jgi:hypothetical protein
MSLALALLLSFGGAPLGGALAVPVDEDGRPPSRLAPLDAESRWMPYFSDAAAALEPALARGTPEAWSPLFGGRWLGAADRSRIAAVLDDAEGGIRRSFAAGQPPEHVILGWVPPEGAAAYAPVADRPEADAILCWRPRGSDQPWPATAAEAEDTRRHGCVRLSYSLRFEKPMWRAFIDSGAVRAAAD